MRICVLGITVLCVTAPAFAQVQSRDVTGPWTLTPMMVTCTDIPVPAKPTTSLFVFGMHSPDTRFGVADGTLIIKRFPADGLAVGQKYIAGRVKDPKSFPRPGEGFGDVRIAGIVTINALDDVNAMADITVACAEFEPGDFLEPYVETVLPTAAAPMDPPDFSERAHLLFGNDNRVAFGFGDTLSIDRGTSQGVVPGARYAIYRDKRNGLPLIYMGEVVVMSTAEVTSKVVVTKALDALEFGDVAVPRRKP